MKHFLFVSLSNFLSLGGIFLTSLVFVNKGH